MPIIKSAKKKQRQDKKRTSVNELVKKKVKLAVKTFRQSPTVKNLTAAYSLLDTAAKKNVYHKNKASRTKSRLSKLLLGKKK